MIRVIGITGKAGSGKSTIAKYLEDQYGYLRLRIAGPLKSMLKALGLSDEEIDGSLKMEPCEKLCGKTPRYGQKSIGTEWGRDLIGEDIWVKAISRKLSELVKLGETRFVIDDVRFLNEERWLREMELLHGEEVRVTLLRVFRVNCLETIAGNPDTHVSEVEMDKMNPDYIVLNDFSVGHLYSAVDGLLKQLHTK